ncbi:MAG: AAA family ATPase [Ardenticatenaceae bacterium]
MRSHHLVPPFILQNFTQNCLAGEFEAVCLFVDTSGFTPLTTALMAHGTEGAEEIANVLVKIFRPLVQTVYQQGGFIVGFAGDAFKAVFPTSEPDAYERAIVAAWQIRQELADQPYVTTPFGTFDFAVKVCVAHGEVSWGIWQGNIRHAAQRAAYYFEGEGLARCLDADPYAKAGEIVITQAQLEKLPTNQVRAEALTDEYSRVVDVAERFSARYPALKEWGEVFHEKQASAFFPSELLELPIQGEFRQVVTQFINFKELPEGVEAVAFQQTFFRLLAQYGGYLCRVGRIGDRDKGATFLLFWGAPTSHENDVARALNFILDLQAETSIPLRAGMTSRMAYAGFVGANLREEYTCYGSYVNLAARLMVSAEWGEIWLDDEIARQAGGHFEVALKGRYLFKGFTKEWPVFRLIKQCEAVEKPSYKGKMIGRTHEYEQLKAAIQPIFEGQSAGLIAVVGEAGIGKSRLVHEFQKSFIASEGQWYLCQTDNIRREHQSLNPFRYFLRRYFKQSSTQSEPQNKFEFNQKLSTLIAATPCPLLQEELRRTRSFIGALVDLYWPNSLYEQTETEELLSNSLQALKTLIKAQSLCQPLILHLEDAHWLDADSIQLIEELTEESKEYAIAIIASMRLEQASQRFSDQTAIQKIALSPLSKRDLTQLATQWLGAPPTKPLVKLLDESADGNPFFVEQILSYLEEQNMLELGTLREEVVPEGESEGVSPFRKAPLPPDVRAILIPQLDRLGPEIKEVVQMASVLGRQFEVQLLSQMGQDDPTFAQKVDRAKQASIWSQHNRTAPHSIINVAGMRNGAKKRRTTAIEFKHDFLQEAAYEMQLRSRRKQLHRRAAEAMETLYASNLDPHYENLAHHYQQAGIVSKTRFYLRKASAWLTTQAAV